MKNKNKTVWLSALALIALILCPVIVWGQSLPANPGLYKLESGQYIPIAGIAANDIPAAFTRVNLNGAANDGIYILVINQDITLSAQQSLTRGANRQLTIIGVGAERTITAVPAGFFRTSISSSKVNITLTLGENITIRGATDRSAQHLILVQSIANSTASVIMKEGSKITGFNGSNNTHYPVNIAGSGASFTMDGGEISGNTHTVTGLIAACAGVFVAGNGTFTMNGGTITRNAVNDVNTQANSSNGPGVYVNAAGGSGGAFIMNGGSITGNTRNGAAMDVYVVNNAQTSFTRNGGDIGVLDNRKTP